ncbi:AP-5 complex subunit sigma-1 isoform X1 [Cebidichthys violaceus]|uniref:AP-5 complex subunit sigma-1 isoform X1 n=1 Tax=Cebidichthys violaceus TaxID=271503 RepID=UPI0035C9BCD8
MVRCFLIHTVCPVGALGAGDSRVLYSRVFGPDEGILSDQNRDLSPEERRVLQKEKVSVVARQVRSAVSLSREASGRLLVETEPGDEALALQEADGGVARLRAGDPFAEEMSALWLGVQSLGFTLVCEPHENLLLAEGTLHNLTRHCLETLHMLGQGSESPPVLKTKPRPLTWTTYLECISQSPKRPTIHCALIRCLMEHPGDPDHIVKSRYITRSRVYQDVGMHVATRKSPEQDQ